MNFTQYQTSTTQFLVTREECSQREMTHSCLWLKLMRYLSGNILVSGFSLYFESGQQRGKHRRDSGVLTVVAAGTGGLALVSGGSEGLRPRNPS